jgi:RHS repeat-associated protein
MKNPQLTTHNSQLSILLIIILFCFSAASLKGQELSYTITAVSGEGNPHKLNTAVDNDATSTWTEVFAPGLMLNNWSKTISLPSSFKFHFYGEHVGYFKVSLNGVITFDTATTGKILPPADNTTLPSTSLPGLSIACFWDKFADGGTGSDDRVYTKTIGSSPNRQVWIKWHSLKLGSQGDNYFACVLEESTSNIYMVDMSAGAAPLTSSLKATIGIQKSSGEATLYSKEQVIKSPTLACSDNYFYKFSPSYDSVSSAYYTGYYNRKAGNPLNINTSTDNYITATASVSQPAWEVILGAGIANKWSDVKTLPFDFMFFGETVKEYKVSLNGVVTFTTTATTLPAENSSLPSGSLPDKSIACFWDAAVTKTSADDKVYISTQGTAPNRQLWIKWYSMKMGGGKTIAENNYFACVLEETSNRVFMVDLYMSSTKGASPLTATIGLQNNISEAIEYGSSQPLTSEGIGLFNNNYYTFSPVYENPLLSYAVPTATTTGTLTISGETDATTTGWTAITNASLKANANEWSAKNYKFTDFAADFSFLFFGEAVTEFKVTPNGLLTFTTSTSLLPSENNNLPSSNLPDKTIACFWDAFPGVNLSSNDKVYVKATGTKPNRQLWIKWYSMNTGNPYVGDNYYALVLEETTNNIYFVDQYYNKTSWTNNSMTVGLQYNGSYAVQYGGDHSRLISISTKFSDNNYYLFTPEKTDTQLVYTYAELAAASSASLSSPFNDECADKQVNSAYLNVKLSTGHGYHFGSNNSFNESVTFTCTPYSLTSAGAESAPITLTINQSNPVQLYRTEISDYENLVGYKIKITDYSSANNLVYDSLTLKAYYTSDLGIDVSDITVTTNAISSPCSKNPFTLSWQSSCEEVPGYELQLMRLYNTGESYNDSEDKLSATVDWSKALTILTESKETAFTLSLTEGTGYYVWRARPIGSYYEGGHGNSQNWGEWSTSANNGDSITLSSYSGISDKKSYLFYYTQFDSDKNFIYNRVFTEEGKVAEGISYANGLGMLKQSQRKLQEQNQVLASQILYDYVGRVGVSTLTAPIESKSSLGYVDTLVQDESDSLYSPDDFDSDARFDRPRYPVCAGAPADVPIWENAQKMYGPISKYFSDENQDINIPNAGNYPYSRTVYDKLNRPKKQSLFGDEHRMGLYDETYMLGGLQRTIRTYYSAFADSELMKIFGNETPADTGMYKIIRVDPNEVPTVEYKTLDGKTIATCLINTGDHPLLDDISESKDTIFKEIKGDRQIGEYTHIKEQVIAFNEPTVQLDVDYFLNKKEFEADCIDYCSTCDYTVQLYIVREETKEVKWADTYKLTPAECGLELVYELGAEDTDTTTKEKDPCSQLVLGTNPSGDESVVMLSDPGSYRIGRKITVNFPYSDTLEARYRDYHGDTIAGLLDEEAAKFDPLFEYLDAESGNLMDLYDYLDGLTEREGYLKIGCGGSSSGISSATEIEDVSIPDANVALMTSHALNAKTNATQAEALAASGGSLVMVKTATTDAARFARETVKYYMAAGGTNTDLINTTYSRCESAESAASSFTNTVTIASYAVKAADAAQALVDDISGTEEAETATDETESAEFVKVSYEEGAEEGYGTYTLASSCLEIQVPRIPCDFNPADDVWVDEAEVVSPEGWEQDLFTKYGGYYDFEDTLFSKAMEEGLVDADGKTLNDKLYRYFFDKYGNNKYSIGGAWYSEATIYIEGGHYDSKYYKDDELTITINGKEIYRNVFETTTKTDGGDNDIINDMLTFVHPEYKTKMEEQFGEYFTDEFGTYGDFHDVDRDGSGTAEDYDFYGGYLYDCIYYYIKKALEPEGYKVTAKGAKNSIYSISIIADYSEYPELAEKTLSLNVTTTDINPKPSIIEGDGGIGERKIIKAVDFSEHLPDDNEFPYGNGAFNSMVTHMIKDPVDGTGPQDDYDYDSYELFLIWADIVDDYELLQSQFATTAGSGTAGLDLLEYFLQKTGKHYVGYADHPYGIGDENSFLSAGLDGTFTITEGGGYEIDGLTENYGYGNLEFAYRSFPFSYEDYLIEANAFGTSTIAKQVDTCTNNYGITLENPIDTWKSPSGTYSYDKNEDGEITNNSDPELDEMDLPIWNDSCGSKAWYDGSIIEDDFNESSNCKAWEGVYTCLTSDLELYASSVNDDSIASACDNSVSDDCMIAYAAEIKEKTIARVHARNLDFSTHSKRNISGISRETANMYSLQLRDYLEENIEYEYNSTSKTMGTDEQIQMILNLNNRGIEISDEDLSSSGYGYVYIAPKSQTKSEIAARELTRLSAVSSGLDDSDIKASVKHIAKRMGWDEEKVTAKLSTATFASPMVSKLKTSASSTKFTFKATEGKVTLVDVDEGSGSIVSKEILDFGTDDDVVELPGLSFKWGNKIQALTPTITKAKTDCDSRNLTYVANQIQNSIDEAISCRLSNSLANYDEQCVLPEIDDSLSVSYTIDYHQYTLFYYDLNGNLIRTVPPKGVDVFDRDSDGDGKNDTVPSRKDVKNHTYLTEYKYNSLGQRIYEKTPDGGEKYFYYNKIGQLRFTQNEQQYTDHEVEYFRYDALGRLIESGAVHTSLEITDEIANNADLPDGTWNAPYHRIVLEYGNGNDGLLTYLDGSEQNYIDNRIYHSYYDLNNTEGGADETHTYYSYDPHGNVEWMATQIGAMAPKYVYYKYDLITGKVKEVKYNEGQTDQFYHRYSYDSDNRVTSVETSSDGVLWDVDAKYEYYAYGPLKRVSLGNDNVQGIDYIYTINGWLKGVNHQSLDSKYDPGADGSAGTTFAKDAFGMTLGYFNGDFKRGYDSDENGTLDQFSVYNSEFNTASSEYFNTGVMQLGWNYDTENRNVDGYAVNNTAAVNYRPLFNGTITNIAYNTQKTLSSSLNYDGEVKGMYYNYDELYRLTAGNFDIYDGTGLSDGTGNGWTRSNDADVTDLTAYKTTYTYDKNGNITNLTRYGGNDKKLDDLTYYYNDEKSFDPDDRNNRLRFVDDKVAASSSTYTYDLEDQKVDNYTYNAIGELTADEAEGITNIAYTHRGKVASVTKGSASTMLLFYYDAMDNRTAKYNSASNTTTYYIRDAKGQVMAIYENNGTTTKLIEQGVSGTGRLGVVKPDETVTYDSNDVVSTETYTRTLEQKMYELQDYLGNVRAVVSDAKYMDIADSDLDGDNDTTYTAQLLSSNDYYPYGMVLPGSDYQSVDYRYGYQGKERDNDLKDGGNSYDFGARIYDPRIGRWLSTDPLDEKFPNMSPYTAFANNPIMFVDPDGMEPKRCTQESDNMNESNNMQTAGTITDIVELTSFGMERYGLYRTYDLVETGRDYIRTSEGITSVATRTFQERPSAFGEVMEPIMKVVEPIDGFIDGYSCAKTSAEFANGEIGPMEYLATGIPSCIEASAYATALALPPTAPLMSTFGLLAAGTGLITGLDPVVSIAQQLDGNAPIDFSDMEDIINEPAEGSGFGLVPRPKPLSAKKPSERNGMENGDDSNDVFSEDYDPAGGMADEIDPR